MDPEQALNLILSKIGSIKNRVLVGEGNAVRAYVELQELYQDISKNMLPGVKAFLKRPKK